MNWLRPEGGSDGKNYKSSQQPLLEDHRQPFLSHQPLLSHQPPQSHQPLLSHQPPQSHQPAQRQRAQIDFSFLAPENNHDRAAPQPASGHQPSFSSKNRAAPPQSRFLEPESTAPLSGWTQADSDVKVPAPRESTARSSANNADTPIDSSMKDHGWNNRGCTALSSEITSVYPPSDRIDSYGAGSNFLGKLDEHEEPKSYPPLIGSRINPKSDDGQLTSTTRTSGAPFDASKENADEKPVAKGRTAITLDAVGNLADTTLRVLDIAKHCLRPVMEDFVAEANPVDVARNGLRVLKQKLETFHETTILLIGHPCSGKTSMAYCLSGFHFLNATTTYLPIRWSHDPSRKTAKASIPEPLCLLLRAWSRIINNCDSFCDSVEGDEEVIKYLESCNRIISSGRSSGYIKDEDLSEICQAGNLKDYSIYVQRNFESFAPNDMDDLTFLDLPTCASIFTQKDINTLHARALERCRGCFYVVDSTKPECAKVMPEPLREALENGTLTKQDLYIIVNQYDLLPGIYSPLGFHALVERIQLDFHNLFSETALIENVVPFSAHLFLLGAAGRIRYKEKYQDSGRVMQKTLQDIRNDEIMSKICFLAHGTHWFRKLKTTKDVAAILGEPEKMLADTSARLRSCLSKVNDGVCPQVVRLVQTSLEHEVNEMIDVIEKWEAEEMVGVVDEKLEWSFEAFYADVDRALKSAYKKACPEKSEIENLILTLPENPPYNMPHAEPFDSFTGIKIFGCYDDVIDYLGAVCFRMIEQWQADYKTCFNESIEILRSKLPKWERGLTRLLVKQETSLTDRLTIPTTNPSDIMKEPGKLTTDSAWESFCDVQCQSIRKTRINNIGRLLWRRQSIYVYDISPTFLAHFLHSVMEMWISLSTQALEDMFLTLLDNDLDWVRSEVSRKQFIKHDYTFMMELGPILKKLSSFRFSDEPEMYETDVKRLNNLCSTLKKAADDFAEECGCRNQIFGYAPDEYEIPTLQLSRKSMYYA